MNKKIEHFQVVDTTSRNIIQILVPLYRCFHFLHRLLSTILMNIKRFAFFLAKCVQGHQSTSKILRTLHL